MSSSEPDELTTQALAEFDAETHFLVRAQRGPGRVERGLALLRKARTGSGSAADAAQ